ncbi:MAG: transglutaminase domain-containing protein [Phycisphaerae bacterium]|nr:transglutaminase domain-containing protein [Phycisphaerae bacterium]
MLRRKRAVVFGLLAVVCSAAFAQEETSYLAVFMEGKKVGHSVHTRTVEGGRVTTTEEVSITISRMGAAVTIEMTETNVETTTGKPLQFAALQRLGSMTMMKVAGVVNDNGVVDVTSSSMGSEQKSTMQWPTGAVMAEGLRLLTIEKGLKPGVEYSVSLFSPGIMQAATATVVIKDKKEVDLLGRVVKLTETTTALNMPGAGPVVTTSYVDDDTRILKSVVPLAGMMVEMIDCPKEFALGANDVLDLIDRMFQKSPEPLKDVHSTVAITYTLNPGTTDGLLIPSTDNQKAVRQPDGRVILEVRPVAAPAGGAFPYRGNDPNLLEAMKPTRFLQSHNERVMTLARKAVGDTKDAAEAARRIESFVAEYIDNKSLSVGYASAAEVAESRQGDCSEFAVLTAAMCRAVGIPAQVVVGVAYVEEWNGMQGFGGHAWAQAYLGGDKMGKGGKWIGLDAAFKSSDRGGYDAGHIALAVGNGEPGDFFNMASALGQFQIEKVKVERAK